MPAKTKKTCTDEECLGYERALYTTRSSDPDNMMAFNLAFHFMSHRAETLLEILKLVALHGHNWSGFSTVVEEAKAGKPPRYLFL
jgi:hypothetical protein